MDNRPIGVFDSGLGGLTAVKQLRKIMPNESIVYFGDTARVPYGNRGRDTIVRYASQDSRFLLSHDVKIILIACGTVSTVAHDLNTGGVPCINVLGPTARAAAEKTKNGRIAVIATSATASSGAYSREIKKLDSGIEVLEQACPLFVPLVENGFVEDGNEITQAAARHHLEPVRNFGADTVILGCTHYPIISNIISKELDGVALIDSGRESAVSCRCAIEGAGLLCEQEHEAKYKFYVSDSPESFASVGRMFLGQDIDGQTLKVDIETY